jgi:hypothetical protein
MAKTPAKKETVETPAPAPAPAPVAKADPPKKAPAVNKDPQPKVEVFTAAFEKDANLALVRFVDENNCEIVSKEVQGDEGNISITLTYK